jgi:hypothetical protein
MKLWLDDIREPWKHGYIGWHWAKTADEAIAVLKTGKVEQASLDHDLLPNHYPWSGVPIEKCAGTGYDVVRWMEANDVWPPLGVKVHSFNPLGKQRMEKVIERAYTHRIIQSRR